MPSPPGPNVYVVVSPNPGKETRVAELLRWVADEVKAHEPWVTMYRCMEANDAQGKLVDYYVVFRYVHPPFILWSTHTQSSTKSLGQNQLTVSPANVSQAGGHDQVGHTT